MFPAHAEEMHQDKESGRDLQFRYQQLLSKVHEDRRAVIVGRESRDMAVSRSAHQSPIRGAVAGDSHRHHEEGDMGGGWNRSRRVEI